ncbi:MAG: tyrosine-type recombinase/integrase [Streptosporangiaceae bacterium]
MSTFTSNFAPRIEAMPGWRTSLGHTLRDMRNAMAGFDRFCASHHPGETVLTRELATAWCQDTATGTWGAYRSRAIREFGKYLQLTGADGFIVPSAWIASPVRSLPHMFTDDELAAFFRAADSLGPEYRSPFREYAVPVIFRLILGAGLRPPEARRLRRRDVHAENAMVMIERSKRNKDRRVPVTGDLARLLARFDRLADLRRPDREWFFEDQHGRQCSPDWLIAGYHLCCERAGGIAPASTPYTLRHNHATRTLMRWVEEGKGHRGLAALPGCLHGTPEVLLDGMVRPPAARAPRGDRADLRGRHHPGGDAVTTRQQAADGFCRHLREWFTAFLPRQRGAAANTITSCRHTWNMVLGYAAGHHHAAVEKVTFAMLDRATVTGFPGHMQATKSWTASTRNQRLACIRSFFTYAAAAEPALAIYLAGLAAIPRLNGPAAAPVKYMTTDAAAALLAAPDPGTRLGLRTSSS